MDQITPIISISTSFLQRRCPDDGYAMMAKARELGYKYVELGHSLPVTLIDGIVKAVGEGVVKICSLHNFCPMPVYALGPTPNLFSPSTKNAGESSQWQRYTRNTVELAGQLGARAVVAHSGALSRLFFNPGRKLGKYLDGAPISQFQPSPQFQKDVEKFRAKTAERAMAKDYKFLAKNLEEISDFCVERGVYIGIENREGRTELPLDWTFKELFSEIGSIACVKAWHDVGHSKIKELEHLYQQQRLIEDTLEYIGGWHIHDCDADAHDHIGLGDGCIDFRALRKYFDPQKHIFTLELSGKVTGAKAADSLKFFEDLLS